MPYEIAALLAALCWTVGGLISTSAARTLGGLNFTRIRMSMVFILLALISLYTSRWTTIENHQLPVLVLSGLIGILLGDTALFSAMGRLGPRRTAILFSTNAPMSAVIGYFWFDERLSTLALVGCVLVMLGVVVSIRYGTRANQVHHFEDIQGSLTIAVGLGLVAALSQSVGSVLAKPALEAGADPVSVAAIRTGIAAIGIWLLQATVPIKLFRKKAPLTRPLFFRVLASGVIGMGLGMTLLLYAFAVGDIGVASILSSTNPIMLLPMIWLISGERPANGAWWGALSAVGGTALILIF